MEPSAHVEEADLGVAQREQVLDVLVVLVHPGEEPWRVGARQRRAQRGVVERRVAGELEVDALALGSEPDLHLDHLDPFVLRHRAEHLRGVPAVGVELVARARGEVGDQEPGRQLATPLTLDPALELLAGIVARPLEPDRRRRVDHQAQRDHAVVAGHRFDLDPRARMAALGELAA